VLARQRFRLAVENHKDQRIAERLETLRRVNSEWVGLCVDVGNSFALLEEPLETVRAYAPWAMTVHLKDQGLRETENGFLFADLPLGEGFLELPEMVATLQTARPGIHFNLEMITRDALDVPVLRPDYWSTLGDVPARDLGRVLALLKQRAHPTPFPPISTLSAAEQLAAEENHVRLSLEYAVQRLGL
jgi:sugar phosphate isomerase/epimerase